MTVSLMTRQHLALPLYLAGPMGVGGILAVFATYWDEAWHTDVGRDSIFSAPHVLLYGAIAVVGLGVAVWGLRVLAATRSVRASLAYPPLLAASLGATTALLAGGIDIAWHAAYGRDAVLWSPPHMLAIFGTVALALGVVNGLDPSAKAARTIGSVLVLSNAAAVVFEYETDVPQFNEALYLPVLLMAVLVAATAIERLVPIRGAVALVTLGYALLRFGVAAGLAGLDRSVPDPPLAILGLAAWSLPWRNRWERPAAAAAAISWLAWIASAADLASPVPDSILATVLVASLIFAGLMLRRLSPRATASAALVVVGGLLLIGRPDPAAAHDPGQGDDLERIHLRGNVSGQHIEVTVQLGDHCDDLAPVRIVGRRAGEEITGTLTPTAEACTVRGTMTAPAGGRWFTYTEFRHEDQIVEAWLPLIAGQDYTDERDRWLYEPAGDAEEAPSSQILFGALIYGLGAAVAVVALRAARWSPDAADARTHPAAEPANGVTP